MRKTIIILIVSLIVQRQFFDESIPCLRLEDNCAETEGSIKDDELDPPANIIEPEDDPILLFFGEANPIT